MTAVNTLDGIAYGFRLMGYLLFVFAIGFGCLWVGVELSDSNPLDGETTQDDGNTDGSPRSLSLFFVAIRVLIGFALSLAGFFIIWAGLIGTAYKVIADAVKRGNEASS